MRTLAAIVTVALSVGGAARAESWEPVFGLDLGIGGGVIVPTNADARGLFELAPRVKALVGSKDHFLIGPAVTFRTGNFQSAELCGALLAKFVVGDEYALTVSVGGGYASRRASSGAYLVATLEFGLFHLRRMYKHLELVVDTAFYLSERHAVTGPPRDEGTIGLSFGGGLLDAFARVIGHD